MSQISNSPVVSSAVTASIPTPPDWDQIQREITCPLCGYNLRGLTNPICPECGHHFDWPTVLTADQRIHPYLFEHHPERNIASFLKTVCRNFKPFNFWKTVQPVHPIRVGRLLVYWITCGLISLLPAALAIWLYVHQLLNFTWQGTASKTISYLLPRILHDGLIRGLIVGCILWACFPLLNFLSLRVFAQSMRRAKVKPMHVLRCTIYCGDIIFWNALFEIGLILWCVDNAGSLNRDFAFSCMILGGAVVLLINSFRLVSAYRLYMNFDHVVATIFASQLMVALAILALLANALWML